MEFPLVCTPHQQHMNSNCIGVHTPDPTVYHDTPLPHSYLVALHFQCKDLYIIQCMIIVWKSHTYNLLSSQGSIKSTTLRKYVTLGQWYTCVLKSCGCLHEVIFACLHKVFHLNDKSRSVFDNSCIKFWICE